MSNENKKFKVIKVDCTRELHDKFKNKCADDDKTMSSVLIEMVLEYLKT